MEDYNAQFGEVENLIEEPSQEQVEAEIMYGSGTSDEEDEA